MTKNDSLPPGEDVENCVVNPIAKIFFEELKIKKNAKKLIAKLKEPPNKPKEEKKLTPRCEDQVPSRDKLTNTVTPNGRVESEVIATAENRETLQAGRSAVKSRKKREKKIYK
jgi:hypothetical protein